ncbi:uncharacterized protein [Montipora capricornis]|uniref:uncharacterized protein n=1 Tax=Montipora capricornis TaxID=246305 RepID=UPI0035F1C6BC
MASNKTNQADDETSYHTTWGPRIKPAYALKTRVTQDDHLDSVTVTHHASRDPSRPEWRACNLNLVIRKYSPLSFGHKLNLFNYFYFFFFNRYILRYENLLRRVNCKVIVSYWDWSLFSMTPWRTDRQRIIPTVSQLRPGSASGFHTFELNLRVKLHDTGHCRVGGDMSTHTSANAPEFFLRHAFIDKI